jgi:3-oxoacyl-[acyl-carrier protein] reductase
MSDRPVVLITGTRTGIGRHLAEHYLSRGYQVVGCSRRPADLHSDGYHHHVLDVADEAAVRLMCRHIARQFGRVDGVINNAGAAAMNHALLTPLSTVQHLVNTNFVGTFLLCREAARQMQRRRFGRIVNFSTVAVPLNVAGEAIYVATKAAVESLTRTLAYELAPFHITVNAVGPTPVKTDLTRAVPPEKIEAIINRQTIKRYGEFRDIVNVVDFFLRPESDFVTGQVIYLGGV